MPTAPMSYTGNLHLGKWPDGANPGAAALNKNWDNIDRASYVLPEAYGAKGDGIIDDTEAITNTLAAALTSGGRVLLSQSYKVTEKIDLDLNYASLNIEMLPGAKITSSAVVETNNIKVYEGALRIRNGGLVKISGIDITASNAGTINYLNGLLVENCSKVVLENTKVINSPFAGMRIIDCDTLSVVECNASNNLYAGLIVQNCKHITILGGEYSYNGLLLPSTGYGITLTHRSGLEIDNESVTILGVKAYYNKRKGIDVHGGVGGSIMGCHVKGFGNSGIYALAEAGSDPDNPSVVDPAWLKYVKDWIISDNTIENDATWYNAECTAAGISGFSSGADGCAIFIGSYGNGLTFSPGMFNVHDNLIRNCDVAYNRGIIFCFTQWDGAYSPDSILIHDNTIMNATVHYSGDGVIHISGINHPKAVAVHNNIIDGSSPLVFYTNVGDSVTFHYNTITGTYSDIWDIDYSLNQKTPGNTYNGKLLPELLSRDIGKAEYHITTSSSGTSISTIKINANEYEGCFVNCNIEITTGAYNLAGIYNFAAYAGNNGGSVFSNVKAISRNGVLNDPATNAPSVEWSGSTNKTLVVNCPAQYTGYYVTIKIAGWRLKIKGA